MPGARELINEESGATTEEVPAEQVRLFLPSGIPETMRSSIGKRKLYEAEAQLRRAACSSALMSLRLRLHTKRHLIMFRNAFLRGQRKTGHARTMIDAVSDRVDALSNAYRSSQVALKALEGPEGCGAYRTLEAGDVTLRYVQDHDGKAARRLAKIAGRPTQVMNEGTSLDDEDGNGAEERGSSKRTLSWIWTAGCPRRARRLRRVPAGG